MAIKFRCRFCNHKLRAPGSGGGKRAKCKCGQRVVVPRVGRSGHTQLKEDVPVACAAGSNHLAAPPIGGVVSPRKRRSLAARVAKGKRVTHPFAPRLRKPGLLAAYVGMLLVCAVLFCFGLVIGSRSQPSTPVSEPVATTSNEKLAEPVKADVVPVVEEPKNAPNAPNEETIETNRWESSRRDDTVAAYQKYLATYPSGRYASDAKLRLLVLNKAAQDEKDHRAWKEAALTRTVAAYQTYLRDHPEGAHVKDANDAIEDCTWKDVQRGNTHAAYQKYLEAYPKGRHAAAAAQAQNAIVEEELWATVSSKGTMEALQEYLTAYPEGRFAGEARVRIAPFQQAALAEQDKMDWVKAKTTNTVASLKKYLVEHPQGQFIGIANQCLEDRQREDMKQLAGLCRGKAAPRAAAYSKGPGIHPIACLTANGTVHEWNNQMPNEWRPGSLDEMELVLIVGPQRMIMVSQQQTWDKLGRPAGTIKSYRAEVTVRVLAARTGQMVAQADFYSAPRAVNPTDPNDAKMSDSVDFHAAGVQHWLQKMVSGNQ